MGAEVVMSVEEGPEGVERAEARAAWVSRCVEPISFCATWLDDSTWDVREL